ncbi:MAG TPA: Na/Pi symporter [Cyclobacteriaceae bacterium]|nr:Na/Pi symporter [Cyclobacteriaceae bacterium]
MDLKDEVQPAPTVNPPVPRWKIFVRNTAYILAALFIFLLALDLMISSLQHLGASAAETIIMATSNPFTGLFIGLLVTAIIQSSSATTSMVVALVASGSITLEGAIPIIMGANVGTTITSTIVSLGFITRKKEFRRAVSAGTYHDFFNILTVMILFPLEYYYGFLSGVSEQIANAFFNQPLGTTTRISFLGGGLGTLINSIVQLIDNGFILVILSFVLLFGSILFFRRVLSKILGLETQAQSGEGGVQRFFFRSSFKSFGWGLVLTAAIRSSTITTSLVVPLVAKKVIRLNQAVPFILGANIGTTITAFIAAMSNSNIAISIAIAHFLFNFIGVLIFSFIPYVKTIPVNLAKGLGKLTIRYRLAGFVYILLTFFFIPFSLIYLNRSAQSVRELVYSRVTDNGTSEYKVVSTTFRNHQFSSWAYYGNETKEPEQLIPVERRKNILMINNELFEFNKPGSCRDGQDADGQYRMCIVEVLPNYRINETLTTDSVFVFRKVYGDSHSVELLISASDNVIVSKLATKNGKQSTDLLKGISDK